MEGEASRAVEPARVHLADVGDEVGLGAPRLTQEFEETAEQRPSFGNACSRERVGSIPTI